MFILQKERGWYVERERHEGVEIQAPLGGSIPSKASCPQSALQAEGLEGGPLETAWLCGCACFPVTVAGCSVMSWIYIAPVSKTDAYELYKQD